MRRPLQRRRDDRPWRLTRRRRSVTQQATGGNLADTLSKLSGILRDRKKMRDKMNFYKGIEQVIECP